MRYILYSSTVSDHFFFPIISIIYRHCLIPPFCLQFSIAFLRPKKSLGAFSNESNDNTWSSDAIRLFVELLREDVPLSAIMYGRLNKYVYEWIICIYLLIYFSDSYAASCTDANLSAPYLRQNVIFISRIHDHISSSGPDVTIDSKLIENNYAIPDDTSRYPVPYRDESAIKYQY